MRSPRFRLSLVAGMCLLLGNTSAECLPAAEKNPLTVAHERTQQLREELDKKLNQTVEAKFDETPLEEAVATIAESIKADVIFDRQGIEEEGGLCLETTVTLKVTHTRLSARDVLHLLLRPEGLVAVNHKGIVYVTSATIAEEMLYVRVYDVRDIIDEVAKSIELAPTPAREIPRSGGGLSSGGLGGMPRWDLSDCLARFGGSRKMAMAALVETITLDETGNWRREHGDGGQIMPLDGRLIITQTDENHRQIQHILDALRSKSKARGGKNESNEGDSSSIRPTFAPLPTD